MFTITIFLRKSLLNIGFIDVHAIIVPHMEELAWLRYVKCSRLNGCFIDYSVYRTLNLTSLAPLIFSDV